MDSSSSDDELFRDRGLMAESRRKSISVSNVKHKRYLSQISESTPGNVTTCIQKVVDEVTRGPNAAVGKKRKTPEGRSSQQRMVNKNADASKRMLNSHNEQSNRPMNDNSFNGISLPPTGHRNNRSSTPRSDVSPEMKVSFDGTIVSAVATSESDQQANTRRRSLMPRGADRNQLTDVSTEDEEEKNIVLAFRYPSEFVPVKLLHRDGLFEVECTKKTGLLPGQMRLDNFVIATGGDGKTGQNRKGGNNGKTKSTDAIGSNDENGRSDKRQTEIGNKRHLNEVTTGSTIDFKNKTGWRSPNYKKIAGTDWAVDAFNYGYIPNVSVYFLSHFHADHYGGLDKHFRKPIICSQATGCLIHNKLGVLKEYIFALDIGKVYILPPGNVQLRLFDANHCPGAVLFHFYFEATNKTVLHTGDFRAAPRLIRCLKEARNIPKALSTVYLDTTYCDPKYVFPDQSLVVDKTVDLVRSELAVNPKTLIVCGTYCIGKEILVSALAKTINCKIGISKAKMMIWSCLDDPELKNMATTDYAEAQIHCVFGKPTNKEMMARLRDCNRQWTHVLGIWPSGWEFSKAPMTIKRSGKVSFLGVPYSEHSSYSELVDFVQSLRPKQIISTVGSKAKREESEQVLMGAMKGVHSDILSKLIMQTTP